jgi:hypothetical protein
VELLSYGFSNCVGWVCRCFHSPTNLHFVCLSVIARLRLIYPFELNTSLRPSYRLLSGLATLCGLVCLVMCCGSIGGVYRPPFALLFDICQFLPTPGLITWLLGVLFSSV